MKLFIAVFVIVFSATLGSYYLMTLEKEEIQQQIAAENGPLAADDDNFSLPDDDLKPEQPAATISPAKEDDSYSPAKPVAEPVNTVTFELPEILDAAAADQLCARNYSYTHKSFLDAIAADEFDIVELFLQAGMKTEFAIKYDFQLPENSQYLFYAEKPGVLYNPLSLAIVASASRLLPRLLAATDNFVMLNDLTCSHYDSPFDKPYFDLFALAIRTRNLDLLRTLLKAGFRPQFQAYLAVALRGLKDQDKAVEKSPEERKQTINAMGKIMIELINNGQRFDQRLPLPLPVPTPQPIEIIFMLGGMEFREKFIEKIADPQTQVKLQELSDRIKNSRPPLAEAY